MELELYADMAAVNAAISELSLGLESLDSLEGFPQDIRDRIQGFIDAPGASGVKELADLSCVTTNGAGKLIIQAKPGPLLESAIAALRALQGNGAKG